MAKVSPPPIVTFPGGAGPKEAAMHKLLITLLIGILMAAFSAEADPVASTAFVTSLTCSLA
jgi:hypothetical protein